ncbi:MAG: hypothetical protein AB7Q42_22320 [Acidimicrobiia bacterium]
MSGLDRQRIALVVATAQRGADGDAEESVATGYFLTGDLVLTARHVAELLDCVIQVRAEGDGPEASRWADATVVWRGEGDVDALVVRTTRRFGDWEHPRFATDFQSGAWESSGFARMAVDEERSNRKTLPMNGTTALSLGQGPPEFRLSTDQIVASGFNESWRGVSGAPIFSTGLGDERLIGIVTEAGSTLANGLVGLPASRLLGDIRFVSAISDSFIGQLPSSPWCLVVTAEGSTADVLGQVSDVFARDRNGDGLFTELFGAEPHHDPIGVAVLEAIGSVENWAAVINALARADVLVVDVTDFQPAVMLILGVRSVLRRGVTISVTATDVRTHAVALPFNVQETRVLPYDDEEVFHDDLYRAIAEGASNVTRDENYLDLPAYHGVRAPRPAAWADEDSKNILVLCPFSDEYASFYRKLRPIVEAHTPGMKARRMLDLRSPRLVGQALYEQVRWATYCIVDWSEWRANVFFELGVRLAASEHDPLAIIDTAHLQGRQSGGSTDGLSSQLEQYAALIRLFDPVVYERGHARDAIRPAVESHMRPDGPRRPRRAPTQAVPPGGTFAAAQASFVWQNDPQLGRPDREQRDGAWRILGRDQMRLPERLILFAANDVYDTALRAAVRERWIAAWLYLQHLSNAEGEPVLDDVVAEFARVSQFLEQALATSTEPRHKALRKEVRELLRAQRAQRSRAREDPSRDR